MSEPDTSPFSEPKSRRWVWIVPSVLFHLLILVIWLLLPEPEPRKPGERELTIKEEQAEELQEHLEASNLEELREKVSELQSIKAAMARIREKEMAGVVEFEQDMVQEAPQDIAGLLRDLAGIYESVRETYSSIQSSLELFREWQPKIQQAAEEDVIDGLRLLPNLEPYWKSENLKGLGDRFEVAFYEVGATLKAIEVKLEWVEDPALARKIAALEDPMETTRELHRETWKAVPSSWKRVGAFNRLTEDLEGTIETVQRFRQGEIEGKAQVAEKREGLEAGIAEAKTELARVSEALKADEAALEKIDRGKERKAWRAKRKEKREHDRAQRQLKRELRDLEKTLSRTKYKPDRRLAREVDQIENGLRRATPEPPSRKMIAETMTQQQEMIARIEDLAKALEVPQ